MNSFKDWTSAAFGTITLSGVLEEGSKVFLKSVPVVGPLIHHGVDRIKDINVQKNINNLASKSKEYANKIASFTSSLSDANSRSEKLQNELSALSSEQVQQKEQISELIKANEDLKDYLNNAIEIIGNNISEIDSEISDSKKVIEILQTDYLSQKEKLESLQILASAESERINNFESYLQSISLSLEDQAFRINENFTRIENLEKKVKRFDEFKAKSDQQEQKIIDLLTRLKSLESEKTSREQLSLFSEVQELQKKESELLRKLKILDSNRELFCEKGSDKDSRTFGISIENQDWIDEEILLSFENQYQLDKKTYDFYLSKYGAKVMQRWIRSNGSSESQEFNTNESLLNEWKTNYSRIQKELDLIQAQIGKKIELIRNPSLTESLEEGFEVKNLEEIEEWASKIKKDKERIFNQEKLVLEEIKITEESLSAKNLSWKILFFPFLTLICLSTTYFVRKLKKKKTKLLRRLFWLLVLSFFISLVHPLYFFFSYYRYYSDAKKKISNLESYLSGENKVDKENIQIKREEVINSTKVNDLKEINFAFLENYLNSQKYQYTSFLDPVHKRRNVGSFSEYRKYIESWNNSIENPNELKIRNYDIDFNTKEITIIKSKYHSLDNFFTEVKYFQFRVFWERFKKEEWRYLELKKNYPEIKPSYSDQLLIDLNTVEISLEDRAFLEKNNIIPKKENFSHWKKKGLPKLK